MSWNSSRKQRRSDMKCPDCNREIGRFQSNADGTEDSRFNTVKCSVTGRRILLDEAYPSGKVGGLHHQKKRKSRRPQKPVEVVTVNG